MDTVPIPSCATDGKALPAPSPSYRKQPSLGESSPTSISLPTHILLSGSKFLDRSLMEHASLVTVM